MVNRCTLLVFAAAALIASALSIAQAPSKQAGPDGPQSKSSTTLTVTPFPASPALGTTVTLFARSISIRGFVARLSEISGVRIAVEAAVPDDVRVDVEISESPLRTALALIARQGKLVVAPTHGGILLRRRGTLTTTDKAGRSRLNMDVWSDEWDRDGKVTPVDGAKPAHKADK